MRQIFTVGHSTHSLDELAALLGEHGVTAIADVRSSPYSRMNAHFNRENIAKYLKRRGVAYSFLGDELGARPRDRSCYVEGRARYELIGCSALFKSGIARVERGASRYRIALMCAEKDPMTCHRALLVCRTLVERGFDPHHILSDGSLERHEDGLRRVASEMKIPLTDLFLSKSELVAGVYSRRSDRTEYVEPTVQKEHQ